VATLESRLQQVARKMVNPKGRGDGARARRVLGAIKPSEGTHRGWPAGPGPPGQPVRRRALVRRRGRTAGRAADGREAGGRRRRRSGRGWTGWTPRLPLWWPRCGHRCARAGHAARARGRAEPLLLGAATGRRRRSRGGQPRGAPSARLSSSGRLRRDGACRSTSVARPPRAEGAPPWRGAPGGSAPAAAALRSGDGPNVSLSSSAARSAVRVATREA
jgi:hypothetical protein